jgi:hypothetical protein
MTSVSHDVSHRAADLPRLDRVVIPRWLREHRRAVARAARPDAVASGIAQEILNRSLPGRELTFEEIMRAQGVKPFDAEEHRRRASLLTSEDWAELRAALAEAREQ